MKTSSIILVIAFASLSRAQTKTAECTITEESSTEGLTGTIMLEQEKDKDITIKVNIDGFKMNGSQHGFHIHEKGDLGDSCKAAGGHYNPENKLHGGPNDEERHVGDLGNVQVTGTKVETTITDSVASLFGEHSVLDRSFVVHAGVDDLGRGDAPDSNTTGNAGPRMGCCKILETTSGTKSGASITLSSLLIITAWLMFLLQ